MIETRKEKFRRLAIYRTNEVLEKIRILGNLSNKSNYDYTEDDVRKIFSEIEKQIRFIRSRFSGATKPNFKL